MPSSRTWVPVLGWCAATLSSIALASVAMLPVLRTAAPDEGALVSIDRPGGGVPTSLPPVPSLPPSSRAATAPPPAATRSTAPPPAGPAPSPARTRTTTTTTAVTTTVEDGWTVTTDGDGEKAYVRSFRVEGGRTVIRVTEGRVRLVTATPNDGYAVATVQNEPDNLAVYFNEVNHSFIIHVVWNVDRPFVQVDEIGDS